MTPAPMTTICSGTFSNDNPPVDEIKTFSSNSKFGRHDGSDPVAKRILSASI